MSRRLDRTPGVCYKVPMPSNPFRAHRRLLNPVALLAAVLAVALSCSSDPDGPVGSDMDLLGSRPGEVFQDTIAVHADTVFNYYSLIATNPTLQFGLSATHERAIILNFSFTGTATDVGRVVQSAEIRLVAKDITGSFPARFYRLRKPYAEGDSIPVLDTLAVIVDPETGSADRLLQSFPPTYKLPPELVQEWVRDEKTRTAIAIVYTDAGNERIASFNSRQASQDIPRLQIVYTDNVERSLPANADAEFVRPLAQTSNLVVSDGFVRRTYFRVRLDELADQSAVHTARAVFHLVPGSVVGTNTTVVMYAPNSDDPASSDFQSGQRVTEAGILEGDSTVEFKMTNAIFLTLQGTLQDNGFVIRMLYENTEVRQIEFYGSSAPDSLRPRMFITSSTPADFNK